MKRSEIQTIILFNKPEIEICKEENFALYCEIDMFNNHILYFVREYAINEYGSCGISHDSDYYSDYNDAITAFLERIKENVQ